MRKWIKTILSLFLCVSLFGCGTQANEEYPSDYPKSEPVKKSDVLDTTFPQNNVITDGNVVLVDYSNASLGYIGACLLNDPGVKVKLQIEKDGKKYNYDVDTKEMVALPLQMGNGEYSIKILQNVENTSYAIIASQTISVTLDDDMSVYLYPNKIVNYHADSKVVDVSFDVVKGDEDDLTRIYHLYKYVIDQLDYDKQKAKDVENSYVLPDLDKAIESQKGICFDYASLMTALCRIQHIPCKVIVGNTDIEYHAWCEIYLEGEGWINPKVFFEGGEWSLVDPTFADSNADYEGAYEEVYHY